MVGSPPQVSANALRDVHDSPSCVIAARYRPARSTLTDFTMPPSTSAMVTIADCSVGRLHRARRRLRCELLIRFHGGEDLAKLGPVVRRFLRLQ